ncbi:hypothetical protein OKW45_005566 [Paraburkholderia sp. WSM4175]|uniref:hypothetical protein n=1 Tax=Paraburkholderia sp. WSM4175 TaxID=2991072 RepID=UPI003D20D30E
MTIQNEYVLAEATATLVLSENCGMDLVTMQATIAQHLCDRGDSLDDETQTILRGVMVALNVIASSDRRDGLVARVAALSLGYRGGRTMMCEPKAGSGRIRFLMADGEPRRPLNNQGGVA